MEIFDLIGYKLVDANTEQIVVKHSKSNEIYTLNIVQYEGDTADFEGDDDIGDTAVDEILEYDKNKYDKNPIITDIKTNKDLNETDNHGNIWSSINLMIFDSNGEILNLYMEAESHTGFGCNASVHIVCDELDINQLMVKF